MFAEQELLYLPGRCLGQRAVDQSFWDFEARHARPAKSDDLFVIGLRDAWLEFKKCTGRFAPSRVRTSDNCRKHDCRVLGEDLLHFKARNILAARDDDVLGAILDLDRTVWMPNGEVTRKTPVSYERLCRRCLVLEVTFHHGITTNHNLADCRAIPWNRGHCLGISDRNGLDHRIGNTLPRHPGKALFIRQRIPFRLEDARGCGPVGFGSPIKMSNPKAEGLHGPEDGGGRRRATGRNRDRVPELYSLIGGRVSEHIQYDRRAAEMRDPMLCDQPEDLCWLDLAKTYLRSASGDNCPRIRPPGTVKHRQCPKVNTVEGESKAEAVTKRREIGAAVAVDDAFRIARGARGVEQA